MTNTKINIWEREFDLNIEYDCYEGETVTQSQIDMLNKFLANKNWLEHAKQKVEEYCKEEVMQDDQNTKKDNIFSYIKPDYLFVKRSQQKLAIMCKYRYEPEHGLAVVFDYSGKITIGIQDIIL